MDVHSISARVADNDELPQCLPPMIQDLAIGRSQIVLDQLRIAAAEDASQIVFLVASDDQQVVGGAVALHSQQGVAAGAATMVHAAPLVAMPAEKSAAVTSALVTTLDQVMRDRGVTFMQWATDQGLDDPGKRWCQQLGFSSLAVLEYLTAELTERPPDDASAIELRPLAWESLTEVPESFVRLVERTYQGTLDCPGLARHRTAAQTLSGYCQSRAFDPSLWYEVVRTDRSQPGAVGCLILSDHVPHQDAPGVVELVYMGLCPEARGNRWGRDLVAAAIDVAVGRGAERMIMAVDQTNTPARDVYHEAGFRRLFGEAVWVKSL